MTPADAPASAGPIHVTGAFLGERLRAIFPASRFQHELLPAPLTTETLGKLAANRTPFVGLAFLGLRRDDRSGRLLQGHLRWGVYLVTRSARHGARLLGDSQAPGLAQMTHALIVGLHGWTPGPAGDGGAGTALLSDGDAIDGTAWAAEHTACWSQTVELPTSFTAATPDQLLHLATSWRFDEAEQASDTFERLP